MFSRKYLPFLLAGLLLVSACTGAPNPTADPMTDPAMEQTDAMSSDDEVAADATMTETHAMTETMASDDMAGDAMADDNMSATAMMTDTHAMTETMASDGMASDAMADDDMMMELPAWQTMALTNARTGETFTLADFMGKTVFVETMATWCTNCRQQLGNVKSAVARADSEQAIFVAISVETNLTAETLAQYADNNDFPWTFAVATPEMVQALAATFGPTIANPPATPHFLIYPDGSHGDLVTGYESGDQILATIAEQS